MKKIVLIASLLFVFLISFPFLSFSQWEMSEGIDGGEVNNLAIVDSIMFAACNNYEIYSKSDAGKWEYIATGYKKVTRAGNCVFLYDTFDDSPLRSFDGGITWESIWALNNTNNLLVIDTVIFFGNYRDKRSFDYGTTYDTITFPDGEQLEVFSDDSLLYGIKYDNQGSFIKIFKSADYGNNWDSISTNGLADVALYFYIKQIKYLNGTFWTLWRSMSSGYSSSSLYAFNQTLSKWDNVDFNFPKPKPINDFVEYDGKILCSIESYPVYCFNDEDSIWEQYAEASKIVNQFKKHDGKLFCATQQGVCTLDTSGNWTTVYEGMNLRDVTSISVNEGNIYVTANNELFVSDDLGSNFIRMNNVFGTQIITTDSVFYMLTLHGFQMSWDKGESWMSFSDGICEDDFYKTINTCLSISPDFYYIGNWRGLYRTATDSITWKRIENDVVNEDTFVQYLESIDSTILLSEYNPPEKGLFFSPDNGDSFSQLDDNYLPVRRIEHSYYLLKENIYYSDDLTQTWIQIPVNYSGEYRGKCVDRIGDTIITGGRDTYGRLLLLITYDIGEHWVDIVENLPDHYLNLYDTKINHVKIVDGRILASNYEYGLWYRDDLVTDISDQPINQALHNIQVACYPNPFESFTTLKYELKQPENVILTIYNNQGKQVDHLNLKQFEGRNEINWNAEGMPAGVYFYNIQIGNQAGTGKLVLIK